MFRLTDNLKLYEEWTLYCQGIREEMEAKCGKIILDPGNTLLIPSRWIHAVHTPECLGETSSTASPSRSSYGWCRLIEELS